MREQGKKVGLIKLRYLRPFPKEELKEAVKHAEVIGVLDKDISFGYEGTIYTNVRSVLSELSGIRSVNFVGGMGGRDISKTDISYMFDSMLNPQTTEKQKNVEFINMGVLTDE
jgi:pyruvate ferredoxin oxidoreductase alpha subunit